MSDWSSWNSREQGALNGLSMLAQLCYLRVFRWRMDFKSGLTPGGGAKFGYQALAEAVGFDPDFGSKRKQWRPSKSELRAAVGELVRAGLLQDAGSNRHVGLVFFCCLASLDKSEQNRNNTGTTPGFSEGTRNEQHDAVVGFVRINNELSTAEDEGTRDEQHRNNTRKTPMNNKHQYNNITSLNKKAAAVTPTRVRVDDCPVMAALRCCFSDTRYQAALDATKCHLMVGQWVQQGVTEVDVGEVFMVVQSRTAKSFGPLYLDGPMGDLLAERGLVADRVIEVDELQARRDAAQINAKKQLVEPYVDEILDSPVGLYVYGVGMVMASDLVDFGFGGYKRE